MYFGDELDRWLCQLYWPAMLCCNIPIKVSVYISHPRGHISLEILTFTPLLYGLAWLPMYWFVAYFNLLPSLRLRNRSKQRNRNLTGAQQDERWETSQDFLCISSISITILLPHLSSSRHQFLTLSQSQSMA